MRFILLLALLFVASAQAQLAGQVTSKEEGPMEGVLVSAKRAGSTITVTVGSDAKGRYEFPAARLAPGKYSLKVRAAGYELAREVSVPGTANLELRKTKDLGGTHSNAEWIANVAGSGGANGQ